MMYNGNMYTPYMGMQQYQRQEVIRVNGRNGAEAYQMAPNSSILLLDETAPVIWLKTTDGASYPTVTGYKITPIETKPKEEEVISRQYIELDERIKRLEEVINNGSKSNVTDVKPVKTINKQ